MVVRLSLSEINKLYTMKLAPVAMSAMSVNFFSFFQKPWTGFLFLLGAKSCVGPRVLPVFFRRSKKEARRLSRGGVPAEVFVSDEVWARRRGLGEVLPKDLRDLRRKIMPLE